MMSSFFLGFLLIIYDFLQLLPYSLFVQQHRLLMLLMVVPAVVLLLFIPNTDMQHVTSWAFFFLPCSEDPSDTMCSELQI